VSSRVSYTVAASSMGYSIVLCTLISVLCYSVLLVTGYQELHKTQLQTRSELVHTLVQSETYYLQRLEGDTGLSRPLDVLGNGMPSRYKRVSWGGYEVLTTSAWFKEDTLSRSIMVGQQQVLPLALYLTDRGKPLQLSGNTQIKGKKYIPNGILKPAYLTGKAATDFKKSIGAIQKSTGRLPKAKDLNKKFEISGRSQSIDESEETIRLYHPFNSEDPIEIQMSNEVKDMDVSGFVIISSRDSIYIDKSAQLTNILIKAPVVTIGKGFKGTIQVYATEAVHLEEDTVLAYPSSIYLESRVEKPRIRLAKGSKLLGGIAFTNSTNEFMPDGILQMDHKSLVVGGVYCKGKLGLEGTVIGSVYTEQFYLKTSSGRYDNYIMDGIIDSGAIPAGFIVPAIFPETSKVNLWDVIKGV